MAPPGGMRDRRDRRIRAHPAARFRLRMDGFRDGELGRS